MLMPSTLGTTHENQLARSIASETANTRHLGRIDVGHQEPSFLQRRPIADFTHRMSGEKIIVADDHPMFRDGLCRLLANSLPEVQLYEAGTVAEVVELVDREGAPDLFLLDLLFPGMNPRETLKMLRERCPKSSIIIVSMVEDDSTIDKVMGFGADGYIVKSIPAGEMVAAVNAVREGQYVIAKPSQAGLADQIPEMAEIMELSLRQREIMGLIRAGKSNKHIGRELSLSPFTVRNHVSSLFRIFKVNSRAELAGKAAALLH
jgi:DNA-binding NarL/FixJ family response regulator